MTPVPPDSPGHTVPSRSLAPPYHRRQNARVKAELRRSRSLSQQKQPDAWTTFATQSPLGASLLGPKKLAEAESLLVQAYDGLKRREGKITAPDKVWLRKTLERRVQLDDAWGKPDPAARRQAELAKLPKPPEKLRPK